MMVMVQWSKEIIVNARKWKNKTSVEPNALEVLSFFTLLPVLAPTECVISLASHHIKQLRRCSLKKLLKSSRKHSLLMWMTWFMVSGFLCLELSESSADGSSSLLDFGVNYSALIFRRDFQFNFHQDWCYQLIKFWFKTSRCCNAKMLTKSAQPTNACAPYGAAATFPYRFPPWKSIISRSNFNWP